jgi:hypothetical protein
VGKTGKGKERDNHRTSEKRKWKTMETPDTRPRNLDPLSPPDQTFSNKNLTFAKITCGEETVKPLQAFFVGKPFASHGLGAVGV